MNMGLTLTLLGEMGKQLLRVEGGNEMSSGESELPDKITGLTETYLIMWLA